MEYSSFDLENLPDLKQMLLENIEQKKDAGPMADVAEKLNFNSISSGSVLNEIDDTPAPKKRRQKKGGHRD